MTLVFLNTFLSSRFYIAMLALAGLFCVGFFVPLLFPIVKWLLALLFAIICFDLMLLWNNKLEIKAGRFLPKTLSLGYEHTVIIKLNNDSPYSLYIFCIDEVPIELQQRENGIKMRVSAYEDCKLSYKIRPNSIGLYHYENIICLINSEIGLVSRRIEIEAKESIPVYPSIKEMQENEFIAFGNFQQGEGTKRVRRVGQSTEFDHIKNYVLGDDFQKINWKASSHGNGIMVNHYEDERSQPIYLIIDKGRSMKMAFEELTLMSYAINAVLAMSNVILKKYDRAGLITFANKTNTFLPADKNRGQLKKILRNLYNEVEGKHEANFEELYQVIRKSVPNRSLLFLFTNFESKYAMLRILPVLRLLNQRHLLVVILFENTEVLQLSQEPTISIQNVYDQTMAEKYLFEKRLIVSDLNQHGIQTILTKPKGLTPAVIKKYLDLKSRVAI